MRVKVEKYAIIQSLSDVRLGLWLKFFQGLTDTVPVHRILGTPDLFLDVRALSCRLFQHGSRELALLPPVTRTTLHSAGSAGDRPSYPLKKLG
jgi:hypothetical protein